MGRQVKPILLIKRCGNCHETKRIDEFYSKAGKTVGGPRHPDSICKKCRIKYTQKYQAARPEQVKKYKRAHYERRGRKAVREKWFKRFNASEAAYDVQFHAQDGRCAICLRVPREGEYRFAFDHSHETGMARGVLCSACNGALGCFSDRIDLLQNAITYLRAWAREHEGLQAVNE